MWRIGISIYFVLLVLAAVLTMLTISAAVVEPSEVAQLKTNVAAPAHQALHLVAIAASNTVRAGDARVAAFCSIHNACCARLTLHRSTALGIAKNCSAHDTDVGREGSESSARL